MADHQSEEEQHQTKEPSCDVKEETNKASDELEESKEAVKETNLKMDEASTTQKLEVDVKETSKDQDLAHSDNVTQHEPSDDTELINSTAHVVPSLPTVPNPFSQSTEGLKPAESMKENEEMEVQLAEKEDASMDKKQETDNVKRPEVHATTSLQQCDCKKRIQELELELEKRTMSLQESDYKKRIEELELELEKRTTSLQESDYKKRIEELELELEKRTTSLQESDYKKRIEELELELEKRTTSLQESDYKKRIEELELELEKRTTSLLESDYKKRIEELELELEKRKEAETNLFESLITQTKQLEESKMLLEESKLEIASLAEEVKKLESLASKNTRVPQNGAVSSRETEARLEKVKPSATQAQGQVDYEKLDSAKLESMRKDIKLLKSELRYACEAEENSKKAMDDLAFALKEVAIEANQVKEKLTLSRSELQQAKGEAERLKVQLDEAKKEAELHKNTSERLRIEAEESLMAWNLKETEFVNCIRKIEEEKSSTQKKTSALVESLRVAENKSKESKGENQKLRDILKQAINEANVAKEAAGIAKAENSELHDSLAGKEEALNLIAQENETLKMKEAASIEEMKELKRLLAEKATEKEQKKEDKKEKEKEKALTIPIPEKELKIEDKLEKAILTRETYSNKEIMKRRGRALSSIDSSKHIQLKGFTCSIRDFIVPHSYSKYREEWDDDEGICENDDDVKGSIFYDVGSPDSPSPPHQETESIANSDHDNDQQDESPTPSDIDAENERNSRKRRALLRKVGDLIRRTTSYKREPSMSLE